MRILLSGGGTGGSVTPLLAIAEELNASSEKTEFLWLGSKKGLEKKMVNDFNSTYTFLKHGVIPPARRSGGSVAEVSHTNPNDNQNNIIKYKIIFSGKLRRYFSLKNFVDPIFIIIGFFQSLWINLVFKPDIILTAGSFIAVPVAVSGWLLQIPILMHQQDVEIGLANKLMMPFATVITCSLEEFVTDFQNKKLQKRKTYFTGNAVRRKISDAQRRRHFGMSPSNDQSIPNLLVLGGGTGAEAVNTIIVQSISELTKFFNVIHITGRRIFPPLRGEGKGEVFNAPDSLNLSNSEIPLFNGRYHAYPFLNNIEEAYAVADLVITRAGMGVLSELAVLGKPAIIIPIPDSHQEANAKYFAERNAAVVLDQKELAPEKLTETIKNLLADKPALNKLSENISKIMPRDGAKRIAKIILDKIGGEK